MQWIVHGERDLYRSEWLGLSLTDVEIPGHRRFEHHVVRVPRPAAGVIVHDRDRGVLMLWRHRFITDTWGWEIPAGKIEDAETPMRGAAREAEEETGWRPGPLTPVTSFHPTNGMSDHTFHVFLAREAIHVGEPTDATEADRIDWVPVADVVRLIDQGDIRDGLTLCGLAVALVRGLLG